MIEQYTALLPCPFCGGVANLGVFESEDDGFEEGVVEGIFYSPHCTARRCILEHGHHKSYNSKQEAIQSWNTRADNHLQQRVKELEDALEEARPIVCSVKCPNVKLTTEEWMHTDECKLIHKALNHEYND